MVLTQICQMKSSKAWTPNDNFRVSLREKMRKWRENEGETSGLFPDHSVPQELCFSGRWWENTCSNVTESLRDTSKRITDNPNNRTKSPQLNL